MTTTSTSSTPSGLARSPQLPYIVLGTVIIVWGAGPVFAKLITGPPLINAALRFGISIPLLYGLVHATGRRVSAATLRRAALPGLSFGTNLIFVFYTVQEATVAVLAVAVALQPALVLIIAGPMFGERPTRLHILFTAIAIGGAAGVILGAGSEVQSSALGAFYAAITVAMFTVYFVFTRLARSVHDVDPIEWMAAINVWSFVACIPPALLFADIGDIDQLDGSDWFWLFCLAYITGAFGHVLMSWVHGYIDATRSSVSLLLMNVVAVGLAWPVHDEPITWVQAGAGVVVFWAVASVLKIPPRSTSVRKRATT